MSKRSSNVIPFESTGFEKPSGTLPFSELNEIAETILTPSIGKLQKALLRHLELHIEDQNNNQDIMRWVEVKNRLKQNGSKLQSSFLKALTNDDYEEPNINQDELIFELLDNDELEHKLLWQRAIKHFENDNNAELISRITLALDALYPDYKGIYPAMPARICESFSVVLKTLSPEKDIEEMLFSWFSSHLQPPVEELLQKIDNIIIERELEVKPPPRHSPEPVVTQSSPQSHHMPAASNGDTLSGSEIASGSFSGMDDTVFLDSFADQLVSRLEDMLTEDNIISGARGARVRTIELTRVLTTIQSEITQQNHSINDLHYSVTQALEHQGINSRLSQHHEDLINMIGWLFEFILEDHLLSEEVKKSIGLLQIPVLKEAIQDDSFLTNQDHPARALLNAITSAGLEHCNSVENGYHVFMLIEHTVRSIITNHHENPDIFPEALKEFRHNLHLILSPPDEETPVEEPVQESNSLPIEEKIVEIDLSWDELFEEGLEVEGLEEESIEEDTPELPTLEEASVVPDAVVSTPIHDHYAMEFDEEDEEVIILSRDNRPESNTDDEDFLLGFAGPDDQAAMTGKTNEPVIIEGLQPGQWIEFVGKGSHRFRCKLAKLSKDRHRYIFENSSGMRITEITGSDLKKEIENGSVIVEKDNPVFDRAIQAVMHRFKKR